MALAHFHQVQADLRDSYRALTAAIPDVMAGYGALARRGLRRGRADVKTKELIALSIAITRECDGCIAAHGRNLARLGATTEEVAEMIGVAITMNGGPGLGGARVPSKPSSNTRRADGGAPAAAAPAQRRRAPA